MLSSPLGAASAAGLLALIFATLWKAGVRGWFAPLRHGAVEQRGRRGVPGAAALPSDA